LSYTHVSAPSPPSSSYPSHADSISTAPTTATTTKNGWTIVQKGNGDGDGLGLDDNKGTTAAALSESSHDDHEGGAGGDADNDMTFEDLGAEFIDMPVIPRARLGAGCVRKDATEIANGAWMR
jgi:hypothetical protein